MTEPSIQVSAISMERNTIFWKTASRLQKRAGIWPTERITGSTRIRRFRPAGWNMTTTGTGWKKTVRWHRLNGSPTTKTATISEAGAACTPEFIPSAEQNTHSRAGAVCTMIRHLPSAVKHTMPIQMEHLPPAGCRTAEKRIISMRTAQAIRAGCFWTERITGSTPMEPEEMTSCFSTTETIIM